MLRVGVLCETGGLGWFDAELVRRIEAEGVGEVVLAVESPAAPPPRHGSRAALREAAFGMTLRAERSLTLGRRPWLAQLEARVPVAEACGAERLALPRLDPEAACRIRARRPDVVLHLGGGEPRGEVLQCAPHGVLAFRHATPAGYWEVLRREPYTCYSVERLAEAPGAGEVLARGEVITQDGYLVNRHHLHGCSIASMLDALRRLTPGTAAIRAPEPAGMDWRSGDGPIPAVGESLRYLWRVATRPLRGLARRALVGRDAWELRIADTDWRRLDAAAARRIEPPRGRFWADPFVAERGGRKAIFFEEYDFALGRGYISALVEAPEGGFDYAGPVIQTPYHLSFPFVFRHRGEHYMCPESSEAGEIQLWRCTDWPLGWRREKTIVAGVRACDTVLFEHEGRWWMLTNLDRDGTGDFCRELHVFHADSPLAERWTPLPGNPVVTGASCARNGGFVQRSDRLYRVAQAQGFNRYGRSLKLFEITELSPAGYRERLVAELAPGRDGDADGFHHLSACAGTVAFDAVRRRWLWSAALGAAPRLREARRAAPSGLPSGGGAPR